MQDFFFESISDVNENHNLSAKFSDEENNYGTVSINQNYGNGMIRPFINDQLNSRINYNLPEGIWKVKWKSSLLGGMNPALILLADNRIIVQGSEVWHLFDTDGKPITANSFAYSDVVVDTVNSLIYTSDNNSMLNAFKLDTGEPAFTLDDLYGTKYLRSFITRIDNTFYVVSNEQIMDAHSSEKPEITYIESQKLSGSIDVDELKILTNAARLKLEKRMSGEVITAAGNEKLFIAYKNTIEVLDAGLNSLASLKENFIPLAMSIDETSNIYLILLDEENKNSLWVINSKFEKIFEYKLKPAEKYTPPCIGYDGIIYLSIGRDILLLSVEKGLILEQSTGTIRGMNILVDNNLLFSEDQYVFALDHKGERKFVFDFDNDIPAIAPVINDKGEIFVASRQFLYCLTTKDQL